MPKLTETFIKKNPDCIVICNEVGCGVVPMLKEEREYREQVGRMQVILAKSSESVERVICGIEQKIKVTMAFIRHGETASNRRKKVILAGQMNRFLRTDVKCCCATGKNLSCSRPYFLRVPC